MRKPGHMVHLDVKKVGRIPDGGGWRAHGRGSEQAKQVDRQKKSGERGGYVYLHSAVDGYSQLAYTEALPDEKAATAIAHVPGSLPTTYRVSNASSPTTAPATELKHSHERFSAHATNESRPTPHGTSARWRRTTASLLRSSSTPASGYPRISAAKPSASGTSTTTTTDRTAEQEISPRRLGSANSLTTSASESPASRVQPGLTSRRLNTPPRGTPSTSDSPSALGPQLIGGPRSTNQLRQSPSTSARSTKAVALLGECGQAHEGVKDIGDGYILEFRGSGSIAWTLRPRRGTRDTGISPGESARRGSYNKFLRSPGSHEVNISGTLWVGCLAEGEYLLR